MHRIICTLFTSILLLTSQAASAEDTISDAADEEKLSGRDHRQLVTMPEESRELMRQDMLDHMSALSEIIGHLASNDLDAAADVAENRLGRSSMGKHRGTGMGPGKFMPPEMRSIGWGMHDAASELSTLARQGDLKGAYSALQKVTGSCVACHYSYRTR